MCKAVRLAEELASEVQTFEANQATSKRKQMKDRVDAEERIDAQQRCEGMQVKLGRA